ncbi:MAG: Glycosyl transferase, group 1 [Cytophagales bacterium]|jgi:glycosyltransferase involved in cell wall biosynthesis|nr:MAG: Glycosyl transferase, group 1 [Cytophagales bacterium]
MAKRILILCPYPPGQAPSQRFRFEQYIELLSNHGFEVTVKSFISLNTWHILYSNGNELKKLIGVGMGFVYRFLLLFRLSRYDFIFIHREVTPVGPPWFEWVAAKLLSKKIIYDFDDAIWLPNTSMENKLAAFFKWHSKVKSICRWSYRISCGNSYLCDYAKPFNSRVALNPTTIDTVDLHNPTLFTKKQNKTTIIGWTGTHSTLIYLPTLTSVFSLLKEKYGSKIDFLLIADRPIDLGVEMSFIKWNKGTEIDDLLKIDIGIMPLVDDHWANGKCGFKALQYMALSIPAVVSPVGVNSTIIQHGQNGFLCASDQEWVQALSCLIEDVELRKSIGQAGRKTVEDHYSVKSNSINFLSLFK